MPLRLKQITELFGSKLVWTPTAQRTIAAPDKSGTIALEADVTGGLYDPAPNMGSVSGSASLNVANSGARVTIGGNTTFSFTGSVASGYVKGFLLQIVNGGSAAITWPTSIKWPSGSAPSLTTAGTDFLTLWTIDGGTTWAGGLSAKDSK